MRADRSSVPDRWCGAVNCDTNSKMLIFFYFDLRLAGKMCGGIDICDQRDSNS